MREFGFQMSHQAEPRTRESRENTRISAGLALAMKKHRLRQDSCSLSLVAFGSGNSGKAQFD